METSMKQDMYEIHSAKQKFSEGTGYNICVQQLYWSTDR
jgi:hypothetical protein